MLIRGERGVILRGGGGRDGDRRKIASTHRAEWRTSFVVRTASLKSLTSESFDVLVVGAGIHGATAAWCAARMGLKTALIDAGDFGAATSANSLKIIHGGLRYLQHGNFARMRESIRARRRFLALAPLLVKPQAFAIPTQGAGLRGRAVMRVALALNDLVSADRNAGLPEEQHLSRGRLLSRRAAASLWPMLPADTYDGAALWHDALAHDTERLTLAFALSAEAAGAIITNYMRAERLLAQGGSVDGVEARDEVEGSPIRIRSRVVINAAGPWWQQWISPHDARHPLVGAWNLIVRRRWFGEVGVGLESTQAHRDADALVQRGKRNLFFVPWRDGTMIGTVYEPITGDPSAYRPSLRAIESFVDEINRVLPGAALRLDEITLLHVGAQPASPAPGSPEPDKHSEVIEGPLRGLYSIKGVKYTTGLTVGERAADAAARSLGMSARASSAEPILVGAEPLSGSPEDQIRKAVHEEHVVHLTDFVIRRSGMGSFARPNDATIEQLAKKMAEICGWAETRRALEINLLDAHYRWFTPS